MVVVVVVVDLGNDVYEGVGRGRYPLLPGWFTLKYVNEITN